VKDYKSIELIRKKFEDDKLREYAKEVSERFDRENSKPFEKAKLSKKNL
jgi:hypothetical protein